MGKKVRRVTVFVVCAVVLQLLCLLFLTPEGIEHLFPLRVRLAAEKIKPESNTYAAYYDMRSDITDADVIVIGVDYNADETYAMLGHFTRFVKQYNNISDVALDLDALQTSIVGLLFRQTDEARFNNLRGRLVDDGGMSAGYSSYMSELFFVNSTMPPNRKFSVVSYSAADSTNESAAETTAEPAEKTLAEKAADTVMSAERSVFCAVDSRELEYGSSFREELTAALDGKKIVFVQTHYTEDCTSPETHTIYAFPLSSEGNVYFVSGRKLEGFYSYYKRVTDLFGANKGLTNRLDTRYTDFFFVATGAEEVEKTGVPNDQT